MRACTRKSLPYFPRETFTRLLQTCCRLSVAKQFKCTETASSSMQKVLWPRRVCARFRRRVNLFATEKFTAAVDRAGGVRKCFWPAQRDIVTSATQAAPKKSRGPSQGSASHFKPSQGFSQACNHNYTQAHCSHNNPPPQGGYHRDSVSYNNSVAPNYQNTFRGNASLSYVRQQNHSSRGRKRTSSPSPQNGDNKWWKFWLHAVQSGSSGTFRKILGTARSSILHSENDGSISNTFLPKTPAYLSHQHRLKSTRTRVELNDICHKQNETPRGASWSSQLCKSCGAERQTELSRSFESNKPSSEVRSQDVSPVACPYACCSRSLVATELQPLDGYSHSTTFAFPHNQCVRFNTGSSVRRPFQLLSRSTLLIQSDNKSVIDYFRHEEGTKSSALVNLTYQALESLDSHQMRIKVLYIPGMYMNHESCGLFVETSVALKAGM